MHRFIIITWECLTFYKPATAEITNSRACHKTVVFVCLFVCLFIYLLVCSFFCLFVVVFCLVVVVAVVVVGEVSFTMFLHLTLLVTKRIYCLKTIKRQSVSPHSSPPTPHPPPPHPLPRACLKRSTQSIHTVSLYYRLTRNTATKSDTITTDSSCNSDATRREGNKD